VALVLPNTSGKAPPIAANNPGICRHEVSDIEAISEIWRQLVTGGERSSEFKRLLGQNFNSAGRAIAPDQQEKRWRDSDPAPK
jgi:hypothetical protein